MPRLYGNKVSPHVCVHISVRIFAAQDARRSYHVFGVRIVKIFVGVVLHSFEVVGLLYGRLGCITSDTQQVIVFSL